jgi:hypothetical protein
MRRSKVSHGRFLVVALGVLLVIGLLIAGGSAIRRSAWSQGYMMGRLAAGGDDGEVVPYAPYGYPGSHLRPSLFLCGVGPLFAVGLLFLLLVGAGKFFRFRAWREAGGPQDEGWARHWHPPHGPMPPWCWGREKASEEQAEEAEPDVETGSAEPES